MSARPYSIDGQFGRGLFTKITLMKIDICFNQLLERVFWLQMSPILYLAVYFTNKLMVQQWALELPLLSSCHAKNYLNNCLQGFKPVFYRRYIDYVFVLFKSNDHLKYFQDFLNSCHINRSFSVEIKKKANHSLPMLKLYPNKVNVQPQFIENLILVAHIVTYCMLINLVWYILLLIDDFNLLKLDINPCRIDFSDMNISPKCFK